MLENTEVKIGTHLWAMCQSELMIVLKISEKHFEVCGAWEAGINSTEIELISIIDKPLLHQKTELYYASKT